MKQGADDLCSIAAWFKSFSLPRGVEALDRILGFILRLSS